MRASPQRRGRLARQVMLATLGLGLVGPAPAARAKVPLCVRFLGPALARPAEYQRLLEQELRHHPTHALVREGCQAELILEYLRLDHGGLLTGRLRGGVPHRVPVPRPAALPAKVREVVAFLLRREPVYLVENLETSGLLKGPRPSLLRHGLNLYGVGFVERWILTGRTSHALPGALFRFRRTLDRWFLGAVTAFAWNPLPLPRDETGELGPGRHFVRFSLAARLEIGLALFPRAWASLFVSGLFGVSLVHLYGRDAATGGTDDLVAALAEVSLRAGVELLRFHATRISIYGQANLPIHRLKDEDHGLIDAYTPSFGLGAEVSF